MPPHARRSAVYMDWTKINDVGDDNLLVCLQRDHIIALMGITEYLRWKPRWTNPGAASWPEFTDFADAIDSRLMNMNCLQFRPSPTDVCIMEVSYDSGDTWATMFDFGLCLAPLRDDISDQIETKGDELLQALDDLYDETPGSISEDVVYDATSDDDFRDFALCNALQVIVPAMCQAELNRREEEAEIWSEVGDALRAIGEIALGFGQVYITIGAGIASAWLEFASANWQSLSDTVLNDTDAQELVACCMYDAMKGVTPSQTSFEESLDNCGFTGGTFAAQIAGAIAPMLESLGFYLSFLDTWGKLFEYAEAGLIDSCPCPETFCSLQDWTIDDGGWVKEPAHQGAGVWSAAGWGYEDITTDPGERRRSVRIEYPFTLAAVTKVSVICDFDIYEAQFPVNSAAIILMTEEVGNRTDVVTYLRDDAPEGNDITIEWEGAALDMDCIRVFFRSSRDSSSPYDFGGTILLKSIEICGDGTKPPELP